MRLLSPSWRVAPRAALPAVGRAVPLPRHTPPHGCVSVPCWTLGGAPGVLQVVPQVPEAERWCRFPLTLCPPRVPTTVVCVCPMSGSLWVGAGRGGERSVVCSPRRGG
ncbi:unnamed protein product [Rangifer tarandus platyrhynchus]|uniref:Secreted protein n=1 Tax=Rangifer tarandus platyrhynchus TaxID=3082113 RepID=A0ABN8XIV2_RANTA|nr:unnamed protein product [Rangifer tarandus platyrhynchus]CAI9149318.1 unnamed protein product [Rangifer tarandus platyrhynchus]